MEARASGSAREGPKAGPPNEEKHVCDTADLEIRIFSWQAI